MADSIFKTAAMQRSKNQDEIKSDIQNKRRIDKINLSLPVDYKERLQKYCDEHYVTASAILREWIDENCV